MINLSQSGALKLIRTSAVGTDQAIGDVDNEIIGTAQVMRVQAVPLNGQTKHLDTRSHQDILNQQINHSEKDGKYNLVVTNYQDHYVATIAFDNAGVLAKATLGSEVEINGVKGFVSFVDSYDSDDTQYRDK